MVQLAALVGYQPSPGVAANTELAFTIDPSSGAFGPALGGGGNTQLVPAASQVVTIPVGTQVQSVPGSPGQLPQTFETIEQIYSRAAWNAIPPLRAQPQQILEDAPSKVTSLILSGAVTTLKPGDPILILQNSTAGNFTTLRAVSKATVATDAKTTQVDLDGVQPGAVGYNPKSIQSPGSSSPTGQISDITLTDLNAEAIGQVLSFQWDASTLLVLAQTKKWPVEQLEAGINQSIAANASFAGGNAYALKSVAAAFGFNVPNVQVPLSSPVEVFGPGNATLDKWNGPVYLDAVYSQIQPNSFIVLQSASGIFAAQVKTNMTLTHTDFGATAKVSLLTTDASTTTLNGFQIGSTSILCQSEVLPLAAVPVTDPIPDNAANKITLNRAYLGIVAGQKIALSGQRADLPGTTASEIRSLQTVSLVGGYTVISTRRSA